MSNRPSKKPLSSQRVNAARDQAQRSRTIWIGAGVAAVVVFALVVALVLSTGGGDEEEKVLEACPPSAATAPVNTDMTVVEPGDLDYGTVSVEGDPLTPLPSGKDLAVGECVPTISGQQFDGTPITIGGTSTSGKPAVIIGVAHWCPHCQKEVPLIQGWLDANGMPDDVDLLAVSTAAVEERGNWPADDWLIGEGWTVPTLVDDQGGTAAQALGLAGFPYMLVVDGGGHVVHRTSGEKTVAQWEALVEAARTGIAP